MVRATIEFKEADFQRLRQEADKRGIAVESLIADAAVREVPEPPPAETSETKPFETMEEFFAWCDKQKFSLHGWKWNREELYDRKVLR